MCKHPTAFTLHDADEFSAKKVYAAQVAEDVVEAPPIEFNLPESHSARVWRS